MASEEDNFDIDIYGDGGEDYQQEPDEANKVADDPIQVDGATDSATQNDTTDTQTVSNAEASNPMVTHENGQQGNDQAQKIASTDGSAPDPVQLPKQAPQTQGIKRKDGEADDRFIDPGATTALFVSDLHWWVNDDDVRGWANQSQCEDELEDITFSEHKVNGKSKGQAYILFKSPQAATAAKHKIESFGEGQQYTKKFSVGYTNPFTNPFRTLPKDGPMRNTGTANTNRSASSGFGGVGSGGVSGMSQQNSSFNNSGGYRGGRGGGYNNNRGGGVNNMSGFNNNNNRSFQQPMSGFPQNPMASFASNPMGAMGFNGGFQNRGGIMGGMRGNAMGMRGGRGGMMGMPVGMGMGAMGLGLNMPQMGAMGMQGMTGSPFNPLPIRTGPPGAFPRTAQSAFPAVHPARQTHAGFAVPPPQRMWGDGPGDFRNPGSAWMQYTRYSQSPSSGSAATFHSPPGNPSTVASSLLSSTPLRRSSSTGQAGFQGNQTHYNPAMFNTQQQGQGGTGDASWNPHGAKRSRQD